MKKTLLTTAVGVAGTLAFGAIQAAENPFAMQDLGKGYQVAADSKAKDANSNGGKKKETKAKDGKCGEGKCGADKKK